MKKETWKMVIPPQLQQHSVLPHAWDTDRCTFNNFE